MDHGYIESNDLVDRYLADRLSGEELARFEAHFVDCPQCQDQIELAEDFGRALRTTAAQDAAGAGILAVILSWSRQKQAALGAFLLMFFLLPAFWYVGWVRPTVQGLDPTKLERLSSPQVNTPNFLLSLTRAAADPLVHSITLPTDSEWLTLSLEVETDSRIEDYQAVIVSGEGQIHWEREGLRPNIHEVVAVTFPADFLVPGVYQLSLSARDSQGDSTEVGNYHFRIAAPHAEIKRP